MVITMKGCTRIVLLIGKYAIKIPNFRYQWNHFLKGLISNMEEANLYKWHRSKDLLCPVVWASWGGWIVIMKRAEPVSEVLDYSKWQNAGLGGDDKPENYGLYNGCMVKLDYGSLG